MLLAAGAKLLVCHRRLYAEDHLRLFIGTVECYADGIAKVSGFTWTRDATHGFQRKNGRRTKFISLVSGTVMAYELPGDLDPESVHIDQSTGHGVIMTDGASFKMDLSERS